MPRAWLCFSAVVAHCRAVLCCAVLHFSAVVVHCCDVRFGLAATAAACDCLLILHFAACCL
jgi:hypothetical protein